MDYLKAKCKENIRSAYALWKSNLYAPSLHCSYYSCVQYMLHIFYNELGLDKDRLHRQFQRWKDKERERLKKQAIAAGKKPDNKTFSQHLHYISKTVNQMKQHNAADSVNFQQAITLLRELRLKADYYNEPIIENEAKAAVTTAESALNLLHKYYKP